MAITSDGGTNGSFIVWPNTIGTLVPSAPVTASGHAIGLLIRIAKLEAELDELKNGNLRKLAELEASRD